jgi:hypothetical protein
MSALPPLHERNESYPALHLVGLTNAAVIIMSVVLGAVVVMLVLVLVTHH